MAKKGEKTINFDKLKECEQKLATLAVLMNRRITLSFVYSQGEMVAEMVATVEELNQVRYALEELITKTMKIVTDIRVRYEMADNVTSQYFS